MRKYLATLLCSKVSELFRVDHTTIMAILAIAALLSGFGFLVSSTSDSNYLAVLTFAPNYVWAIWFFVYGLEKIVEILFFIPPYIKVLNSLFGMWLWNYIILSFLFFDSSAHPFEYTIITPLIVEVWFLTSLIYMVDTKKGTL